MAAKLEANPFPGLRPFGLSDHDFFFGREQEIDELLNRLSNRRLIAVLGVSGCGKSSLVYAGLLPVLLSGLAEPLGGDWRVYNFWPGEDPLVSLQRTIGTELPNQSHALLSWARRQESDCKILIFVDQFEETFSYRDKTLSVDGGNRAALFVDQILTAVADPSVPLYVVLTMRTDYLGSTPIFRGLSEALNEGSYLVPRLSRLRQQDAIERPAAALGRKLQPALVQRLLNDSEDDPDKLPVLQHLLKVMWECHSGELDLKLYDDVGGWRHTLANDAQSVVARFHEDYIGIKRMLQWLAEIGPAGKPIRRRVPMQELSEISNLSPQRARDVVDAFATRGFIRLDSGGKELVDFTHESVMWQWPELRNWIGEDGEQVARLRFLEKAAEERQWLTSFALKNAKLLRDRANESPTWIARYIPNRKNVQEFVDWIDKCDKHEHAEQKRSRNIRYLVTSLICGLLIVSVAFAATFRADYLSAQAANQRLRDLNQQLNHAKFDLSDTNLKLAKALEATAEDRLHSLSATVARQHLQTFDAKSETYAVITIQYFAKQSELAASPQLVLAWKRLGFKVQMMTPKFDLPSNKVWYGSGVDNESVRAVAYSLLANGFALRQISALTESNPELAEGRERVIQVGWSNQADEGPLLTNNDVQKFKTK